MKTRFIIAAVIATAAFGCKNDKAAPGGAGDTAGLAPAVAAIAVPKVVYSTAAPDIEKGKDLFTQKGCPACHKLGGGKLVGPDLKGVTARRKPEWIARMILRPDIMIKEDETAKELLKTHMVPMPNQNVDANTELSPLMAYLKANES